MNIKHLILFLFIIFSAANFSQEIKETTEQIIKNQFGGEVSFDFQKYKIPSDLKIEIEEKVKQRFFADEVYLYKVFRNKSLIGFSILDNVYGKSMPITFLVSFDIKGNIIASDIVKYREPYGGGVASKNWNSQFKGKNFGSRYEVGSDISGISGATISVHSVSRGIQKLALLLHKIKDKI